MNELDGILNDSLAQFYQTAFLVNFSIYSLNDRKVPILLITETNLIENGRKECSISRNEVDESGKNSENFRSIDASISTSLQSSNSKDSNAKTSSNTDVSQLFCFLTKKS